MNNQISSHFDFEKLAKTFTSSSMSSSGSGSSFSNKQRGVGYRSSSTAVSDTYIGTPVKSGLTTKLPSSSSVYGKGNSGTGSKPKINSTMMKQRSGTVDVKDSPVAAQSAGNTISTNSSHGALYKQAGIGSLLGAGVKMLGKYVGKGLAGRSGINKLRSQAISSTLGTGASPGTVNRMSRLDRLYRGGRVKPGSTFNVGRGATTNAESIGRMSNVINKKVDPMYSSVVKRKALNAVGYGAVGYGVYQGANYVKGTHTPYNKNFNYNRHIRDNVVSGQVDPSQLHPNTIRSIMMKQGMHKEAFVSTLVRKAIPIIAWTALSLPGAQSEYKGKALLNSVRSNLKPLGIAGNIAKF